MAKGPKLTGIRPSPAVDAEEVLLRLKQRGLRMTKTRSDLVRFILEQRGHWTIQDLSDKARQVLKDVGLATVYRTVSLLYDLKVLSETRFDQSAARYEVAPKHHHDHLRCVDCGEIFEFENEKIEDLQEKVAAELGFDLINHRMELYGACHIRACPRRPKN